MTTLSKSDVVQQTADIGQSVFAYCDYDNRKILTVIDSIIDVMTMDPDEADGLDIKTLDKVRTKICKVAGIKKV